MIADVIKSTKVEPRPYQARIVQKAFECFQGIHVNTLGATEAAQGQSSSNHPQVVGRL